MVANAEFAQSYRAQEITFLLPKALIFFTRYLHGHAVVELSICITTRAFNHARTPVTAGAVSVNEGTIERVNTPYQDYNNSRR